MCDETTPTKTKKFITYADVKAEQEKILDQFAVELLRIHQAGVSLREIGKIKKMNHEKVRQLVNKVKT
jgi:hypothetical protein